MTHPIEQEIDWETGFQSANVVSPPASQIVPYPLDLEYSYVAISSLGSHIVSSVIEDPSSGIAATNYFQIDGRILPYGTFQQTIGGVNENGRFITSTGWSDEYSDLQQFSGLQSSSNDSSGATLAINNENDILARKSDGSFSIYTWQAASSSYLENPLSITTPAGSVVASLAPSMNDGRVLVGQIAVGTGSTDPAVFVSGAMLADANGDGVIDGLDVGIVTSSAPFQHWINDDYDNGNTAVPDYATGFVNGQNDLKDFFPVALMIHGVVSVLPPEQYTYVLKQADSALDMTYTPMTASSPYDYLNPLASSSGYGAALGEPAWRASLTQITAQGVTLSSAFLRQISDKGGVLLVDAESSTKQPLVLSIQKSGMEVMSLSLNLSVAPRAILLLHGMNSDPSTWNAFVNANLGTSETISAGVALDSVRPPMDRHGIRYYRLQFGAFDDPARLGVENVSSNDPGYIPCGDFETFATLGSEVAAAVQAIQADQSNVQILLVGHSRGGIAAREFLQNADYIDLTQNIVGLLTTGSPHQGSKMGRIYQWLSQNKRTSNSKDWNTVDFLKLDHLPFLIWPPKGPLDVRRPTINDLSDSSSAISDMNAAVGNLPTTRSSGFPNQVMYGEIVYHELPMGNLKVQDVPAYNVFSGNFNVPSTTGYAYFPGLSWQASGYILDTGGDATSNTAAEFANRGDGLIPAANQLFTTLPGFAGTRISPLVRVGGNVAHQDEAAQVSDLNSQINLLVHWLQ